MTVADVSAEGTGRAGGGAGDGRLAGSVRADDAHSLTGSDLEADAVQGVRAVGVGDVELLDLEQRILRHGRAHPACARPCS
jgi:hypothetical protein